MGNREGKNTLNMYDAGGSMMVLELESLGDALCPQILWKLGLKVERNDLHHVDCI